MAPKKSAAKATKSAMGQPTLSFQQRKPGSEPSKKNLTSRTPSATSLRQTESETSIAPSDRQPSRENVLLPSKREFEIGDTSSEGKERRQLNVVDKRWDGLRRHYKSEMRGMKPIHASPETHNDIHHILRIFDLSSKYGPSVGVSRLQRWERSKKWGLNPPDEIKEILMTEQGEDDQSYRENVLYTWLG